MADRNDDGVVEVHIVGVDISWGDVAELVIKFGVCIGGLLALVFAVVTLFVGTRF